MPATENDPAPESVQNGSIQNESIQTMTQQVFECLNNKQYQEALPLLRNLTQQQPNNSTHWINLGVVLKKLSHYQDSLQAYQQARQIEPDNDNLLSNIGSLFLSMWRLPEAIYNLNQALKINPKSASAHANLGSCRLKLGQYSLALKHYEISSQLDDKNAENLFNLSWCLLRLGEFRNGFRLYETRFTKSENLAKMPATHSQRWQPNANQAEQKLTLCYEQGFGDTIMFIRLAHTFSTIQKIPPQNIYLLVQKSCEQLIRSSFPDFPVVVGQEPTDSHSHIPLLSLPFILGLDAFNIPCYKAYLKLRETKTAAWKDQTVGSEKSINIGFCYHGSRTNLNDRYRSVPFEQFVNLFEHLTHQVHQSITLHALMTEPAAEKEVNQWQFKHSSENSHQSSHFVQSNLTIVWHNQIQSFEDTAAIIKHLNFVVCVDTAVAHLSAAMGKPTYILIAKVHDWRWFRNISYSPWYPSVMLFRQFVNESNWQPALSRLRHHILNILQN